MRRSQKIAQVNTIVSILCFNCDKSQTHISQSQPASHDIKIKYFLETIFRVWQQRLDKTYLDHINWYLYCYWTIFLFACFVIWCAAENILPRLFKNIWLCNRQKYFKQSFVVQVMHQMCQYSSENNLKFYHWLQFLQNLAASHPAAYHSFDSFLKNPFNFRISYTMGQCHIFIIISLVFSRPIIWLIAAFSCIYITCSAWCFNPCVAQTLD